MHAQQHVKRVGLRWQVCFDTALCKRLIQTAELTSTEQIRKAQFAKHIDIRRKQV